MAATDTFKYREGTFATNYGFLDPRCRRFKILKSFNPADLADQKRLFKDGKVDIDEYCNWLVQHGYFEEVPLDYVSPSK